MATEIKIPKTIITGINKNYSKSHESASNAIKYAIKVGEGLIKLKAKTPHGEWEDYIQNRSPELRISNVRHTQKYMQLAKNTQLALMVNDGTIDGTCKAIANATELPCLGFSPKRREPCRHYV